MLESKPVHGLAAVDVDDQQPAAGRGVLDGEPLVQLEAFECLVVARTGKSDHRMTTDEREPARIAGTESDRGKMTGRRIDDADLAPPRIQHPESALVEPRRMGHRKAGHHDLAGSYVEDDAPVASALAP